MNRVQFSVGATLVVILLVAAASWWDHHAAQENQRKRSEKIEQGMIANRNSVIELAKNSGSLDPTDGRPNAELIRALLGGVKGELKICGWSAFPIPALQDVTYLVQYTIVQKGDIRSFQFEVNRPARLVRNIAGDPDLEKIYRQYEALAWSGRCFSENAPEAK